MLFSPDNRWLVTGSEDGTVRLWDVTTNERPLPPVVLHGHSKIIRSIAISANNRWLVTGSDDNAARLWDLSMPDPNKAVDCSNRGTVNGFICSR